MPSPDKNISYPLITEGKSGKILVNARALLFNLNHKFLMLILSDLYSYENKSLKILPQNL